MPSQRTTPPTRKPRKSGKPYASRPGPKPNDKPRKDMPKTSASKPQARTRSNLTLADWLTVFEFYRTHPHLTQENIVAHFATRKEGPLKFSQGAFSRNWAKRDEFEERAAAYPNALSAKRLRIVTRPDVERALYLWFRNMEEQRKLVTASAVYFELYEAR
ncbi:hypothetical protein BDN72DRAFT_895693 [Pluteus cervinus]|uniref:Uncharacterized protein n=1 Tax=Pluteus cervinus TaxID=181527 RepID=A0ACD3B0F1_9AGAR|nr:hypothetical protein BDN72DRAFT_895693 [Pluteus cervinus]